MAQQSLLIFVEGLGLVPRTHYGQFIIICNSSSKGAKTSGLCEHIHASTPEQTHMHTHPFSDCYNLTGH